MLYVISRVNKGYGYDVYDPYTYSITGLSENEIIELLHTGIKIANMTLENDRPVLKNWPHKIADVIIDIGKDKVINLPKNSTYDTKYMYLYTDQHHMAMLIDHRGNKTYASYEEGIRLIENKVVVNCKKSSKGYSCIDTLDISQDKELLNSLSEKYNKFIAKSEAMGIDSRFKYVVMGNEVIYTHYIGTSDIAVIPNFITIIGAMALRERANHRPKLRKVVLGNNIHIIGEGAFINNDIQQIDIPESVQLVEHEAFKGNGSLVTYFGLFTDNITNGKNTMIIQ